jgi:GH15 family glucan-1,4-alpha-glucosidase
VTTSLPERLGGERNWDYRYCWLRDASFCLDALVDVGYTDEALAFREWLVRAAANSIERLQVMYGLQGERRLTEIELPHLRGYYGSSPVRIGNAASQQLQIDIYGEVAEAMFNAVRKGVPASGMGYRLAIELLSVLEDLWTQPDCGIWEIRGERQHFTYSKVMAWVMFDRAIRGARYYHSQDLPIAHWTYVRDKIHADICANAWNAELNTFTQAYGSRLLDASLLRLALVGFLPPSDPRIVATVDAVATHLRPDGLVRRYDSVRVEDGLAPGEGAFLACSFWLADNYILQGRIAEGRALFDELIGLCNDVGLLAEQYDPSTKRHLGNFPQALSHVALVGTGIRLQRAMQDLK